MLTNFQSSAPARTPSNGDLSVSSAFGGLAIVAGIAALLVLCYCMRRYAAMLCSTDEENTNTDTPEIGYGSYL